MAMSVYEALDGNGRVTGATIAGTGEKLSPAEYSRLKNSAAESRRILQSMDAWRNNAFNTPLSAMSRVPDAKVPDAKSVYEVTGGGGGGAKVKRVILSEPLPRQASATDSDKSEEKPKRLKAKGEYYYYENGVTKPGTLDLDLYEDGEDGRPDKEAVVPTQIAVEISVVKGVDYIGIANSTKGRSQDAGKGDGGTLPDGTYDLGASRDIEDSIFVGFYKMDFGD